MPCTESQPEGCCVLSHGIWCVPDSNDLIEGTQHWSRPVQNRAGRRTCCISRLWLIEIGLSIANHTG